MKRIFNYIIILIIGSSLFYSCEGDLMPETFDQLSPDNYPQNEEDVRTLVNGAYNILMVGSYSGFGDVSWQGRWSMNEATTDEFECYWGGSVWETYKKFLWNSGSQHVTSKTYDPYIKAITTCVNDIAAIESIELSEDLKARYIGELQGIMALLGYTLYDFYGPVPIVTDPEITLNPATDFQPERPTKEWMLNFIETNARNAADALPENYSTADYGRITKGTALMVLLKLAMHEKDWEEAVTVSKEIMDLDFYSLQSSYLSIFSVENEGNNEIIFAVPCVVSDGRHNNWLAHVLPSQYVEPNGIPVQKWGGYKVPWYQYDKFETEDKRLESLWGKLNTENGVINIRSVQETWAQLGAVPYKYPADPAATGEAHGNDYVIYRYADVLLLRAEALNQTGEIAEAVELINQVRSRSNASLIDAADYTKESLNDFILDERMRELFMEGHRREDLIRHGKYLSEAANRGAVGANISESRLIFPIPQSAIDENDKIQQNPGY